MVVGNTGNASLSIVATGKASLSTNKEQQNRHLLLLFRSVIAEGFDIGWIEIMSKEMNNVLAAPLAFCDRSLLKRMGLNTIAVRLHQSLRINRLIAMHRSWKSYNGGPFLHCWLLDCIEHAETTWSNAPFCFFILLLPIRLVGTCLAMIPRDKKCGRSVYQCPVHTWINVLVFRANLGKSRETH